MNTTTEYRVRSTDTGFELAVAISSTGAELFVYEEEGSHGPVAKIYAAAEQEMNERRTRHEAAFQTVRPR